jgi:germination protein M
VETVAISLTDLANNDPETATSTENFDADSFVMSFGNNNGYQQKGNIVLYFANESGEALKEYRKSIEISNNTSLAAVVVEALIEGPKQEGYQATIPENTTIRNISVKDSICYIDLSDEFYDMDNSLRNDIIVYSIVNSLAELPTVSKVQFLHNGEKQSFFRETMPFDGLFERNLDLIEQEDTEEENVEVQEEVKE